MAKNDFSPWNQWNNDWFSGYGAINKAIPDSYTSMYNALQRQPYAKQGWWYTGGDPMFKTNWEFKEPNPLSGLLSPPNGRQVFSYHPGSYK